MPLTLLDLPLEVLALIVRHVTPDHLPHVVYPNPNDLPNLRLTCREIHAIVTPEFGRVCVSRCKFILSEYSLRGLIALTLHPVLAPYLKTVSLGTHFLPSDFDDKSEVVNYYHKENGGFMEHIKNLSDMMQEMHSRRASQVEFLDKGRDVELLARALTNLRTRSLSVTLGLYDDVLYRPHLDNAHIRGYGYEEFHGPLLSDEDNWMWAHFSIYRDWEVDPTIPLRTILEASKVSNYALRSFDFDLGYDHSFPLHDFCGKGVIKNGSFHRRIRRILTTQMTLPRKWKLNPGVNLCLRWWAEPGSETSQ
ncbi:hypothetical protein D6D13_07346 [Aureobasidium pullulans]|uniref:F-box domain-containing protein n=1 Tax=Aureobasidium pullulans TaxID=5580 RepID=A0A4S9CDM7_AURPU|nr:hypothetical protein D6D13_07346 [Aureobasidium pullulans]